MADEEQNGTGSSQDLPEIETSNPEYSPNHIPGMGQILYQPNSGRGIWDPIERAMKGSTAPEDFLRLTKVNEAAVGRHKRIQYTKNLARYGNGHLEEVMWSGYNLSCSVDGWLLEEVSGMITGQRAKKNEDWQQKRQQMFQNARNSNPVGENTQKLNSQ